MGAKKIGNDWSALLSELSGVPDRANSRSISVRAADTQGALVAVAREVRALTRPPAPDSSGPLSVGSTGARLVRMIGEN